MEEIKNKNYWIVLFGRVYDVSVFLHDHPGGEEILRLQAGKDATAVFEDVRHSVRARSLAKMYLVGKVKGAVLEEMRGESINAVDPRAESKSIGFMEYIGIGALIMA